jgi:hypothetical protein
MEVCIPNYWLHRLYDLSSFFLFGILHQMLVWRLLRKNCVLSYCWFLDSTLSHLHSRELISWNWSEALLLFNFKVLNW